MCACACAGNGNGKFHSQRKNIIKQNLPNRSFNSVNRRNRGAAEKIKLSVHTNKQSAVMVPLSAATMDQEEADWAARVEDLELENGVT